VKAWVYRALDASGAALYIGSTEEPHRRLRDHERHSEWFSQHVDVEWIECPDRATAFAREAELICQYDPPHNGAGGRDHDFGSCMGPRCSRVRPTPIAARRSLDASAGRARIDVYLTEETDRRVRHLMADTRLSMSAIVEAALTAWLATHEEA